MGSTGAKASELVRVRRDGRMMDVSDEERILRFFLSDHGLRDIAQRTGHAETTVIDVLARYRHANGEPLQIRKSKRNGKMTARPLMEGVDYPDRASPCANLFADQMIQPVDLEKKGRWQDRMADGG